MKEMVVCPVVHYKCPSNDFHEENDENGEIRYVCEQKYNHKSCPYVKKKTVVKEVRKR
jgi:glutathione peroxidase-family protein